MRCTRSSDRPLSLEAAEAEAPAHGALEHGEQQERQPADARFHQHEAQPREPLTAQKAEQILSSFLVTREPVYAEVPQKVWWNDRNPKDDYDEFEEELRREGRL